MTDSVMPASLSSCLIAGIEAASIVSTFTESDRSAMSCIQRGSVPNIIKRLRCAPNRLVICAVSHSSGTRGSGALLRQSSSSGRYKQSHSSSEKSSDGFSLQKTFQLSFAYFSCSTSQ